MASSPTKKSEMRRSRSSSSNRFVFGEKRRELTPIGTREKATYPGVTSPRPMRKTVPKSVSNYAMENEPKKKEVDDFVKWIFTRDNRNTFEQDVKQVIKLLFPNEK